MNTTIVKASAAVYLIFHDKLNLSLKDCEEITSLVCDCIEEESKDLPKPADPSREEYFEKLEKLFLLFFESDEVIHEIDLKRQIEAMTFDRIKELEQTKKETLNFVAEIKKEFPDQNWDYLNFIIERVS